jgi:hypothetical protein
LSLYLVLNLSGPKRGFRTEHKAPRLRFPLSTEEGVNSLDDLRRTERFFPFALVDSYLAIPYIAGISNEVNAALLLPTLTV